MSHTTEQIKALADQFYCHPVSRSIDDIKAAGGMLIDLLKQRDELALSENNLRQQKSHLIDEIACQKSNVAYVSKQRDELALSENNLRQQKSHLIDEIACQKSNVAYVSKQRNDLLSALYLALPFVEDHEGDPCYKAGVVAKTVLTIKAAIAKVPVFRKSQEDETAAPAIVFYPAGSLGEAVES